MAIEYAQKYALTPNPDFYFFGGIGGDCTNFISQCLLAGGGVMNYDKYYGWYYISVDNRSPSWTSVGYLQRFLLRDDSTVGPCAEIRLLQDLEVGDLIQLRQNPTHFNHTLIITKIINGEIYVCAHSNNALNVPLSSFPANQLLGLHIHGTKL